MASQLSTCHLDSDVLLDRDIEEAGAVQQLTVTLQNGPEFRQRFTWRYNLVWLRNCTCHLDSDALIDREIRRSWCSSAADRDSAATLTGVVNFILSRQYSVSPGGRSPIK